MAVSTPALIEIIDRTIEGRAAAGIAVVSGAGARPEAVWVPASALDEPAYLAYSITKTFTAVLILQLRDEQRLTLDDRLARWFPRIDRSDRISLGQLLNHTAGIPDYGWLDSYHDAVRAAPSSPWSFERFAAETFEKGLLFDPGSSWAYSNPGYMLLKRVAEDIAERSYGAMIRERLARPLGLLRTFVPESVSDLSTLAPASSRALASDGATREVRDHYHPGWVSHGVVASTPSDIARFLGCALLRRASRRAVSSRDDHARTDRRGGGRVGVTLAPAGLRPRDHGRSGIVVGSTMGSQRRRARLHDQRVSRARSRSLGVRDVCPRGDAIAEQIVFAVLDTLRRAP
jgi:CubicO group peptidase (beta-lactamase class C family)